MHEWKKCATAITGGRVCYLGGGIVLCMVFFGSVCICALFEKHPCFSVRVISLSVLFFNVFFSVVLNV